MHAYSLNNQVSELHEAKASMAQGLAIVVREIAETGFNPENTLEEIIKLARMLDIAAPAERVTISSIIDPRYNLLDYIKRYAGSRIVKEMDADKVLFDREFTCISQIQEIFLDVSEKINRNFINPVEHA